MFQGPYRAELVEEDDYLLMLSGYIHLNPVQTQEYEKKNPEETVGALRAYPWSSYRGYVRLEKRKDWVDYELLEYQVLDHFGKQRGSYRKYVEAGLAETDEELQRLLKKGGLALGSAEFIKEIKDLYRSKKEEGVRKVEDISFRKEQGRWERDEIVKIVLSELGISEKELTQRRGGGL